MWGLLPLGLLACAPDKAPTPETGDSSETAETADTGDATVWEDGCEASWTALRSDLEAAGAKGGAVAIWADGSLRCAFGVGQRGPDDSRAVDAHTLFRAGPLTTTMTAIPLLARAASEPYGFERGANELIWGFSFDRDPDWAAEITVATALQQSTAMMDVREISASADDEALSTWLLGTYAVQGWLMADPGEMWNASVPGDALAGLLVEYASVERYRQAVADHLLGPLSMSDTAFLGLEVLDTGDYATALSSDWTGATDDPVLVEPTSYDNGWARPSAYAWSSALDLGALLGFLLEGDEAVLGDEAREEMWTETLDTGLYLGRISYGYGLMVYDGAQLGAGWYEGTYAGQRGGLPGYSAELLLSPDTGVGAAVLAAGDDADLGATLEAALGAFGGLPSASEAPDPEIDTADWAALEGSYLDPWSYGAVVVTAEDDALTVSIPLLDADGVAYDPTLTAVARDNFILDLDGEELALTFLHEDGAPARLRTRAFVATREESLGAWAPLPSPPPPPRGPDAGILAWGRAGAR